MIDGLVQERHNSSALAMELCLSCTDPSRLFWLLYKLQQSSELSLWKSLEKALSLKRPFLVSEIQLDLIFYINIAQVIDILLYEK